MNLVFHRQIPSCWGDSLAKREVVLRWTLGKGLPPIFALALFVCLTPSRIRGNDRWWGRERPWLPRWRMATRAARRDASRSALRRPRQSRASCNALAAFLLRYFDTLFLSLFRVSSPSNRGFSCSMDFYLVWLDPMVSSVEWFFKGIMGSLSLPLHTITLVKLINLL